MSWSPTWRCRAPASAATSTRSRPSPTAPDSYERIRNAVDRTQKTVKADYKRPIGKEGSLNLGYNGDFSRSEFDFERRRRPELREPDAARRPSPTASTMTRPSTLCSAPTTSARQASTRSAGPAARAGRDRHRPDHRRPAVRERLFPRLSDAAPRLRPDRHAEAARKLQPADPAPVAAGPQPLHFLSRPAEPAARQPLPAPRSDRFVRG